MGVTTHLREAPQSISQRFGLFIRTAKLEKGALGGVVRSVSTHFLFNTSSSSPKLYVRLFFFFFGRQLASQPAKSWCQDPSLCSSNSRSRLFVGGIILGIITGANIHENGATLSWPCRKDDMRKDRTGTWPRNQAVRDILSDRPIGFDIVSSLFNWAVIESWQQHAREERKIPERAKLGSSLGGLARPSK